jgi:hypothetical protein
MTTLSSQLAALSALLVDTSKTNDQRVVDYYTQLALDGVAYGALALRVVNNNPLDFGAQISNQFTADYAAANGIPYTASDISNLRLNLAQDDLLARQNAGGIDLQFPAIRSYHVSAFTGADLPIGDRCQILRELIQF